jgi:DNA-binding transcriptional regulator YdaS (Cro superfamily)
VPNVYARTLKAAAARVGGNEQLARRLGVSNAELDSWCAGYGVPPLSTILKATDLHRELDAPRPQPVWMFRLRSMLWRVCASSLTLVGRLRLGH